MNPIWEGLSESDLAAYGLLDWIQEVFREVQRWYVLVIIPNNQEQIDWVAMNHGYHLSPSTTKSIHYQYSQSLSLT